tara:strand:+ start:31 stop:696 length:666 start_codon:yes stop_codon:yes gene_type:complete
MLSILNYGSGNIKAFYNIFNQLNIDISIVSNPNELSKATKIILPGVGSFDNAMNKLNNSGLRNELENMVINKKVPILGICVGFQMMLESSEEGKLSGLGWIRGKVKKFSQRNLGSGSRDLPNFLDAKSFRKSPQLPHMGWNKVQKIGESKLITNLNEPLFYFLHSYYVEPFDQENIIAKTDYDLTFCSAICKDNVFGVQFHPEKSHSNGTYLLENFAKIEC